MFRRRIALSGVRDRGATAVDYLGAVVVVAAVTTGLAGTSLGTDVYQRIEVQICRITGGSCAAPGSPAGAAPRTDKDFEPKLCNIASSEDKAGDEVKIAWFTWGNEYGFQQQEFKTPDGKTKVYLTFTDAASVGVKGSPKVGAKIGRLGVDKVDLGAGVKVTNGDTWVFDSADQAQRFRNKLEDLKMWEESMKYGGGTGMPDIYGSIQYAKKKEEIDKELGNRHISFGKIGLDASAEVALKKAQVDGDKLGVQFGGKFRVAPEVTVTRNDASNPPTTGYTYQFQMEYSGNMDVSAGPLNDKHEAGEIRTGTVTVTRYKDGSLARIDITQSVEGRSTETGKGTGQRDTGAGDGKKNKVTGSASQKDKHTTITTNSLVFPPDSTDPQTTADRRTAENWLNGNGDNAAPFQYLFGDRAPTSRPGADDPFGRLMFDKGISSRTEYDGMTDAQEYGFEVNLGLSLGAKISFEKTEQHLTKADFLGAPKPDGTRGYLPYSYCAN